MDKTLEKLEADVATAETAFANAKQGKGAAKSPEEKKAVAERMTEASEALKAAKKAVTEFEKSQQPKSDETTGGFEVSANQQRRRAGMKFGPEPVIVNPEELEDGQWKAINADPMLKVVPVE